MSKRHLEMFRSQRVCSRCEDVAMMEAVAEKKGNGARITAATIQDKQLSTDFEVGSKERSI